MTTDRDKNKREEQNSPRSLLEDVVKDYFIVHELDFLCITG